MNPFISTVIYKPYFNSLNWLRSRRTLSDYGILLKFLTGLGLGDPLVVTPLLPPHSEHVSAQYNALGNSLVPYNNSSTHFLLFGRLAPSNRFLIKVISYRSSIHPLDGMDECSKKIARWLVK